MNNKISIIVPCYNQAQYLDECLQSVLDQIYQNWECIIVNDGSPDNTEEIAIKWTEKDSRFKYLKKENGGLSSARNKGIENAKGKYILPLDSDDKISTTYLSEAINIFDQEPNTVLVYCNAWLFGGEDGLWDLPEYNYFNLLFSNHIFCSGIFKKEDWIKVDGYDENIKAGHEDWDFWLRILNKDSIVVKLPITGFYYRKKQESMINDFAKNHKKFQAVNNYIFKKQQNIVESYIDIPSTLAKCLRLEKQYTAKETEIYVLKNNYRKLGKQVKFAVLLEAIFFRLLFKLKGKLFDSEIK
jgi:glycosyltransferase involved in cell wall biosynthesis